LSAVFLVERLALVLEAVSEGVVVLAANSLLRTT